MNEVVELFAYITCACGEKFQVLEYDEDGNPVGCDLVATSVLSDEHYVTCPKNPANQTTEA